MWPPWTNLVKLQVLCQHANLKFRSTTIWRWKTISKTKMTSFYHYYITIESNMFPTVDLTGLGHADFWLVRFIISSLMVSQRYLISVFFKNCNEGVLCTCYSLSSSIYGSPALQLSHSRFHNQSVLILFVFQILQNRTKLIHLWMFNENNMIFILKLSLCIF